MSQTNKSTLKDTLSFRARLKRYRSNFARLFRWEHYPTLISRDAKRRMAVLNNLTLISAEQKSQINKQVVRFYFVRFAHSHFIEDRLHKLREIVYRIAILIFALFIGIFGRQVVIYRSNTVYTYLPDYIRVFLPVILLILVMVPLSNFITSKISYRWRLFAIVVISIGSLLYLSYPRLPYSLYVFGILGFMFITSISIIIDEALFWLAERYRNDAYPEGIVIHNLLFILGRINEANGSLAGFDFKQECAIRLEFAAHAIENYFYKHLKTSDGEANEWIRERTRQIACALREKKRWFFMPKPDTVKFLIPRIADFLIHLLRDEWDYLETPKPSPTPSRFDWKAQLWLVFKTLIIGFSPLGGVITLQYLGYLPEVFNATIFGIAATWALVNLPWLDPATKDKISYMKDVASLFKSSTG